MAKHVIEDAQVTLNSVDLSNRVRRVVIQTSKRTPAEVTAMTDNWEDRIVVDIRAWRTTLEFYQDYAASNVYATLKGILDSTDGSGVALVVRPTTEARSATNPEFQGQVALDGDFGQIDAEVGGVNMANPSFLGIGALSFVTTSS